MILRAEREGDASSIQALTIEAFGGTQEADLVQALRAGGHMALSLVVLEGATIVGHVLFSPLVSPASTLALAPVSVAPGRQRQGIGARLICFGLEMLGEQGWGAVFVVGNPAYYRRFGFRADMAASFASAYPSEYVMALELRPGALEGVERTVVYPAPFQAIA